MVILFLNPHTNLFCISEANLPAAVKLSYSADKSNHSLFSWVSVCVCVRATVLANTTMGWKHVMLDRVVSESSKLQKQRHTEK